MVNGSDGATGSGGNQPMESGEMARRVRETDWSRTPLGAMEKWPASLRVAVGICLTSRFPMFVWWGPELINIYNDAYVPILGNRHPALAISRFASEATATMDDTKKAGCRGS